VKFDFVYVDKLKGEEREEAVEEIKCWNKAVSFPTIVIDDKKCIIGYKPKEIKTALGL
jgi:glutaredoxin